MITNRDTAVVKRILLVDDEGFVRETVRLLLGQIGYRVVEANNGAEALGLFAREHFDLVMTDYEMPFLKGNELAARIRRLAPRQPILMMTGFGYRASEDNPVDAVITKPLDFERLRTLMEDLLSGVEVALAEGCLAEFNQSN
jgi:CheY-like chemotaxis protein